jgi:hypothetical protein
LDISVAAFAPAVRAATHNRRQGIDERVFRLGLRVRF